MKGKTTNGLHGITNTNLSTTNCIIKDLTFEQIYYHYQRNDFIIPDFQRTKDTDKIKEMVECYKKNPLFFRTCTNPIQIAQFEVNKNDFNNLIIDGQHRLFMILHLAEDDIEGVFTFALHKCKKEREAINIFKNIIKGSEKEYSIPEKELINNFRNQLYYKLRKWLENYYSDNFVSGSKNKYIYNIENFLCELKTRNFLESKKKFKKFSKITSFLQKKNKKFIKKCNYESNLNSNPNIYYKQEIEKGCLLTDNICVFGLRRCNFIDYLFNKKTNQVHPFHPVRYIKQKISKKLKNEVWIKEFGRKRKQKCPIENCENKITKKEFHCGHIISEINGGLTELENLRPLCASCNLSMGTNNWNL